MNILAIDTSTKTGSVAVVSDEKVLFERSYETKESHAEVLIKEIDRALKKAGVMLEDVDYFAVAIGPGSFTGLRIGLSTAKGLAIAEGKPVIGVSTLEALFLSSPVARGVEQVAVVPCMNAYRGEVYASAKGLLAESSMTPEKLCEELLKHEGKYLFVGDGATYYNGIFSKVLGDRFELAGGDDARCLASSVAGIAFRKIRGGDINDTASLVPNYIRRSDAELKKSL